jgi:hypothetical protein
MLHDICGRKFMTGNLPEVEFEATLLHGKDSLAH